jgi:hypothetical protein
MTSSDYSAELPSKRKLLVATAIAIVIALLVVILFVMPAEYGKDPTGFGKLTGISDLHEPAGASRGDFVPVNTTGEQLLSFNVSWVPREAAAAETDGESGVGESTDVPLAVPDTNVTRVTAVLSWSDEPVAGQATDPDLFEVNITAPTGETRSFLGRNEGPSGTLTAAFVVTGFPPARTVTAKDHDGALDAAAKLEPPRHDGTGAWNVKVRLVEAGGVAPFNVGDEGNAWTLRLFVQVFVPALGDPQLTAIREDEVKLTIPAQGQLEFKARLNETAEMAYEWSAAAQLNYEFHGDASGAQGDRFESYEKGTAASKSGTFKAPFTGRHGWYWQNTSLTDVEVTLKLRGDYVIVGIV